jgi:hypothetical protein
MPPEMNSSPRPKEGGQLFAGWVLGIFLITAMIIYVADAVRRSRTTTQSTVYRELALNVAKAGFEEGLSFFRTHTGGCFLTSAEAPLNQDWIVPWPTYPDAAFEPQADNTDFYDNISMYVSALNVTCAGGIIGDIPMDQYVTVPASTTDEMTGSSLWGRYVIRRQNVQNWSPGPDTATVNTDIDACHDISAISSQSPLGSGTRWSIVSRGYLLRLPSPVTTTSYASSLLGNPAAFTGNNLLSAPLGYYNNQPFLLAQARVYGALTRVNFNVPSSAVMVPYAVSTTPMTLNTCEECSTSNAQTVILNENAILNGTGGYALTAGTGGSYIDQGSAGNLYQQNLVKMSPSITNCFPGQTWGTLQKIAIQLEPAGGSIQGYYGGIEQLPVFNGTNAVTNESFQTQVNQPAFYFLNQSITLGGSTTSGPVLSGVGLCIIKGNLTIPAGNNSTWSGVLYVEGQVILDGPTDINGILISETGIELGNAADLNKTTVAYDGGAINLVQSLLKSFIVDSSSIVANQF